MPILDIDDDCLKLIIRSVLYECEWSDPLLCLSKRIRDLIKEELIMMYEVSISNLFISGYGAKSISKNAIRHYACRMTKQPSTYPAYVCALCGASTTSILSCGCHLFPPNPIRPLPPPAPISTPFRLLSLLLHIGHRALSIAPLLFSFFLGTLHMSSGYKG